MKNLSNIEINAVSGGAEVRFCDVEKKGDPNTVYGRFSFNNSTDSAIKNDIYELIKKELLNKGVSKDLNANYTMTCYIFNQ